MQTKYKNIYRPSTGAVMLLAAVHTCDQVRYDPPVTSHLNNNSLDMTALAFQLDSIYSDPDSLQKPCKTEIVQAALITA